MGRCTKEEVSNTRAVFAPDSGVTEEAPIGIARASSNGRILSANDAFCRLLGYSRRELTGKTVRGITHPDDWKRTREYIRRVRGLGSDVGPLVKRYVHKDGQTVWAEVHARATKDASGRVSGTVAYVVDITYHTSRGVIVQEPMVGTFTPSATEPHCEGRRPESVGCKSVPGVSLVL
jgi:PAS domain S-box-containing protein